jgi:hypothetical protein
VGMTMPRRSRTKRPVEELTCSFLVNIKFDSFGFYIVGGRGQAFHCHHPKRCQHECGIPSRLINADEKDLLTSLGNAKACDGVGRNVFYSRTGGVLTRKQVRYINGFNEVDDCNHLVSHSRDLKPGESSVDKLLQSLRDKGFGHCVLYN